MTALGCRTGQDIRLGPKVLQYLAAGESCVCEIQAEVPVAANLLSYHLRVLREAGLVLARRRGRWVDYRLAPGARQRLTGALPVPPAGPDPAFSAVQR